MAWNQAFDTSGIRKRGKNCVFEVRYHDSVNVLQEMFAARGAAWEPTGPFDRPEWYAGLAETGLRPLVVTAQNDASKAALVLTQEAGRLSSLTNWYSFTWRPLVSAEATYEAALEATACDLRGKGHRVTLAPVPNEDGSATRLAKIFAAAGWRVEVSQCDTNHVLKVQGRSFSDYWASRPGPLRTTLTRKGNKVAIDIIERFDEQAWRDYESVYEASWKPAEGEPAMLREFAQAEGKAGRLRLGIARHEAKAIAAQFWTVENATAYIHKLAHRDERANLSAGTVLTAALFKRVIDQDGVDIIDFGTGNEPYKRDWMEAFRPRFQIDCLDMKQPQAWIDLARLAMRRSREPHVPALARLPLDS
ncbi:MAG: GNAT family N-acetyltransferase [Pseudomonadota bacterium]